MNPKECTTANSYMKAVPTFVERDNNIHNVFQVLVVNIHAYPCILHVIHMATKAAKPTANILDGC